MAVSLRGAAFVAATVIVLGATLVGACAEPRPEPYVRVSIAAPALAGAPASRALLVTFWATWCPGCREEADALTALAAAPPAGLGVVVVSEDATLDAVTSFFGGAIPPLLHVRLDEQWRTAHALRVDRLPTSVLIVDGTAVARFDGARAWSSPAVRHTLTRLIQPTQGASP